MSNNTLALPGDKTSQQVQPSRIAATTMSTSTTSSSSHALHINTSSTSSNAGVTYPVNTPTNSSVTNHLPVPLDLPSPTSPTSKRSNALLMKLRQQMQQSAKSIEQSAAAVAHRADNVIRDKTDEPITSVEDAMLETLDYDEDQSATVNGNGSDSPPQTPSAHAHSASHNPHSAPSAASSHSPTILFTIQLLITMMIALLTALCMWLVSAIITFFVSWRVNIVMNLLASGEDTSAYFAKLGISVVLCLISACMVAILAPDARGSGVPFCMAYLNGTNVQQFFSLRIVAVKTLSLAFTIASGLTLGKEGPFVHIGAGIAYCIHILLSVIDKFSMGKSARYTKMLRTIQEERIFIAGGMAAGLTVAFAAPIAGILFALEGSTAFITVQSLIRIFGCAMFASFFNDWRASGWSSAIVNHNLINKTRDESLQPYAWQFQEVIIYLWLAVVCGSFAAVVTRLNVKLTAWRHHHMLNATWVGIGKNIAEVCFYTIVTATIWFVLPYLFACRPDIPQCESESSEVVMCRQAHCQEGYWSELGSIVYATPDGIARLMLDRSLPLASDYHTGPLLLYALIYFILVGCQYGIYTPGGLFVPAVVAGAVIGRCHGIWLAIWFPTWNINTGVYGMLGAAAMLGGFNRLVLPIILMVIEMTGDSTYLLPIMICGSVAKFFADWLEPPLYPQHMKLEGIPQLGDKLDPQIAQLTAYHIMKPAAQIPTFTPIVQLQTLRTTLSESQRVTYPVLNESKQLIGMISRRSAIYALQYEPTYEQYEDALTEYERVSNKQTNKLKRCSSTGTVGAGEAQKKGTGAMIDWHDTTDYAATIATIRDITAFDDTHHYVCLLALTDRGAVTAHAETPSKRIAALFRRVGVSHLCVTDHKNHFLGVITRRNLVTPPAAAANATQTRSRAPTIVDDNEDGAAAHNLTCVTEDTEETEDTEPGTAASDFSERASIQMMPLGGTLSFADADLDEAESPLPAVEGTGTPRRRHTPSRISHDER